MVGALVRAAAAELASLSWRKYGDGCFVQAVAVVEVLMSEDEAWGSAQGVRVLMWLLEGVLGHPGRGQLALEELLQGPDGVLRGGAGRSVTGRQPGTLPQGSPSEPGSRWTLNHGSCVAAVPEPGRLCEVQQTSCKGCRPRHR